MTPSQEERLASAEQQLKDHERRMESIEDKIGDIYDRFQTYLPRWITAAGVGMGMALGSSLTVIVILTKLA